MVNADATLTGSGTTYTVTLTPRGEGKVSVFVMPNGFSGVAGKRNTVASNTVSAIFDITTPEITPPDYLVVGRNAGKTTRRFNVTGPL